LGLVGELYCFKDPSNYWAVGQKMDLYFWQGAGFPCRDWFA